ncbi:MAG: hypothetical protein ACUVTL_06500 [Thermoproteota archaeon]
MSLQKFRSEAETIHTSYITMKMQLKLVLGYLKDEVPETTLARQFLLEAKKTALELEKSIEELRDAFMKIDSKLERKMVEKLDNLHKFILSHFDETQGGIMGVMNKAEEKILGNDVEEAAKLLDSLQLFLEKNEANTDLCTGIDWDLLEKEIKPEISLEKKEGMKKISIVYSSSPDNEYLAENLVGKFFRELGYEPTYSTDRDEERSLDDSDIIFAFFTKDSVGYEKYIKRLEMGPRRKIVVCTESGVDVPQEIKNRFEIRYFSRDRTGELLIDLLNLLKSHQIYEIKNNR